MYYHWLGIVSDDQDILDRLFDRPPECDGDFENMVTIEADGFITCHFSGPIRPIQN